MPAGYESEEERRRAELEAREAAERNQNRGVFQNYDIGRTEGASDFDETSADIPIWGWLTGAEGRVNAANDAREADRNRQYWERLAETAPTAAELAPDYYQEAARDEYGDLLGGPSGLADYGDSSAGQAVASRALRSLYESGGYTAADQAASRQAAMAQGQRLRGANEAALQQMQARGMGGSGAELAARLQGSQSYAMGNAMSDAAIQQAAMQRAFGALQSYGSMETQRYGQGFQRRAALDAYNQQNTDWRRGREQRNTAWANREEDGRTRAVQQAYQNREGVAAGITGQYSTDVANRNADANRDKESEEGFMRLLGTLSDV